MNERFNPFKNEKHKHIDVREYGGTLHQHTGSMEHDKSPKEIIERREASGASNCGQVILEAVVAANEKLRLPTFRTDHFSDGAADFSLSCEQRQSLPSILNVQKWFYKLYEDNPEFIKIDFPGKNIASINEFGEDENRQIAEWAEKLIFYDNKRAKNALENSKKMNNVSCGFECNVMTRNGKLELDGKEFIEKNRESINGPIIASIHTGSSQEYQKFTNGQYDKENKPKMNKELAEKLADKLTEHFKSALNLKHVNILGHPHCHIHPAIIERVDWIEIAEEAIKNNVAIEINIQDLMKESAEMMRQINKYPFDSKTENYKTHLRKKLEEGIIPLLSSEKIMNQLKPFFAKGLKIAINTDAHKIFYQPKNGFIENPEYEKFLPETKISQNIKEQLKEKWGNISETEMMDKLRTLLNIRFWYGMKLAEKYLNDKFEKYDIKRENVINLYSLEKLENFLKKEG